MQEGGAARDGSTIYGSDGETFFDNVATASRTGISPDALGGSISAPRGKSPGTDGVDPGDKMDPSRPRASPPLISEVFGISALMYPRGRENPR